MADAQILKNIESKILAFQSGALKQNTLDLFSSLGYESPHQMDIFENTPEGFLEYLKDNSRTINKNQAYFNEWTNVDFCLQLTNEESVLFESQVKNFDGIMNSYLLFCIELSKNHYPNRVLADITRAMNRVFANPVFVLFKHGSSLTFSIINRRKNKKDSSKEVLEKITLIKDIDISKPHRAHQEILFDLSLFELRRNFTIHNFDDLHSAWQKVLDTKELNKRFYLEIFKWYEWAVKKVKFPNDINDDFDDEKYNSENIIRLLTRIIFIWFLKEKNLIPDIFFKEDRLDTIINDFKGKTSTNYYKAILQNLFFATLNQKINERQFAVEGDFKDNKKHYGVKNLFRYSNLFKIDQPSVLKLFEKVPFVNGGLFDCLDNDEPVKVVENGKVKHKVLYFDGFSRNTKKQANVPDILFFNNDNSNNLKLKDTGFVEKGLFNILKGYKFTVTENTPVEEEIALDPELLGRIFENLLASYNPETGTTARKATGSFYTPREIVNYMVDESLIAYLTQTLSKGEGLIKERVDSSTYAYITTTPERWKHLIKFAKEQRKAPTKSEEIIWEELRNSKLEFKFRRQHPIEDFIVDFVCLEKKLVVEIDGGIHTVEEIAEYDKLRTEILSKLGFCVIRFSNDDVLYKVSEVIEKIKLALNSLSPLEKGLGDEVRLRHLLSYTDEPHQLNPAEVEIIIKAIDNMKILDPACGSGAFPMGILQKLVFVLHKLDPDNKIWLDIQREKIIKPKIEEIKQDKDTIKNLRDDQIREKAEKALEERLNEINDAFNNEFNYDDYARKLFLIENCIYGVDIQTIAIQISKLRCFISLIIDQKGMADESENYGIKSLPNLETKFVAANTLIALDKPRQLSLRNPEIETIENEIISNRHNYFTINTRAEKIALQEEDKKLRSKLTELLKADGWSNSVAEQISNWDPFNQNASSSWFEPEWMFGIQDGFDIVIGNPPYIQLQKDGGSLAKQFEKMNYQTFAKTGDIYALFYEKGINLLRNDGNLIFITSNKWMRAGYGEKLREFFTKYDSKILIDLGPGVFESATVDTNILMIKKVEQTFLSVKSNISKKPPELIIKKRNLPHWTYEGSYYFITFRTINNSILSDKEKNIVFDHILEGNSKFYHLICFVVMPDHVHMILRPFEKFELSSIMKGIKGVSANKINEHQKSKGSIWQSESFDRIIRDYSELNEKVNYILNNPIKNGICENSSEYDYLYLNNEYDNYKESSINTQTGMSELQHNKVEQTFVSVDYSINVHEAQTGMSKLPFFACTIKSDFQQGADLAAYFNANKIVMPKMTKDAWTISGNIEMRIKEKIERIGTPLKDWDVIINKGLMTGLNEAFYIDKTTKERLISEDINSAEIIKPLLRGRDIKRYFTNHNTNLFVILVSDRIIIEDFPAILKHLRKFEKKLKERAQYLRGDHEWYAVDNCPSEKMIKLFDREKIIYPNMTQTPIFTIDKKMAISNDKTFLLVSENRYIILFLCSFLNSKIGEFIIRNICSSLGSKGIELRKIFMNLIPIPKLSPENQLPFINLVDKILKKKENNENTKAEEREIDMMVYDLYSLSAQEIAIIEKSETK